MNINSKTNKDNIEAESTTNSFYAVFISTFATVFTAELGDKTQIATLLITAKSGRPIYVFIASSLALISTSLIAVLLGRYLASKVHKRVFNKIAGIVMILIGLVMSSNTLLNYSLRFN